MTFMYWDELSPEEQARLLPIMARMKWYGGFARKATFMQSDFIKACENTLTVDEEFRLSTRRLLESNIPPAMWPIEDRLWFAAQIEAALIYSEEE